MCQYIQQVAWEAFKPCVKYSMIQWICFRVLVVFTLLFFTTFYVQVLALKFSFYEQATKIWKDLPLAHIDCCSKFATGLKCSNWHRSKSIWVTSLFFCQNDSPMSESFWQKNRLVTHTLFDLCLFKHSSPVTNFGYQSLQQDVMIVGFQTA